jgi:hypothetical protein
VGFLLSGGLFIGGSVGLELIGGKMVTLYGRESWQYLAEMIAEESLESIGLALFVVTILEYWRVVRGDVRVSLVRDSAASAAALPLAGELTPAR